MFGSVVKRSIITKDTQKQVRTAFMRVVTLSVDGKKSYQISELYQTLLAVNLFRRIASSLMFDRVLNTPLT